MLHSLHSTMSMFQIPVLHCEAELPAMMYTHKETKTQVVPWLLNVSATCKECPKDRGTCATEHIAFNETLPLWSIDTQEQETPLSLWSWDLTPRLTALQPGKQDSWSSSEINIHHDTDQYVVQMDKEKYTLISRKVFTWVQMCRGFRPSSNRTCLALPWTTVLLLSQFFLESAIFCCRLSRASCGHTEKSLCY